MLNPNGLLPALKRVGTVELVVPVYVFPPVLLMAIALPEPPSRVKVPPPPVKLLFMMIWLLVAAAFNAAEGPTRSTTGAGESGASDGL